MASQKQKAKLKSLIKKFWPLVFIFVLVLAFAFPYWAKGLVPFPSTYLVTAFPPWQYYFGMPVKNNAMPDVLSQMYPWKHLLIDMWKTGEVPLWNPYNFSGSPLLANYQSAVFHPANWLFFIFSEADAWSLMILLQPLLAGWFTYLFLRQIGVSRLGTTLGAIAFMFCGFITVWMAYGTMVWAILWLPLSLYAIDKSLKKASFFSLVLVSFSLAASFFGGHFQTSIYVMLVAGFYLFYNLIITRKFKSFLLVLVFIILGMGITLPQILPTLELYNLASRSKSFGISEIVPWNYSVTTLVPDFYGNPVTRNDWYGHYAEWSSFTGVIPLILAFYLVFIRRDKTSWFFILLGVMAFILTRPTPLLDLLVKLKIPVLGNSAAARIIPLFSLSVAVLAGLGLDRLQQDIKEKKFKPILSVTAGFLALFGFIWIWLFRFSSLKPEALALAKRNFILPSLMVLGFLVLLIGFYLAQRLWFKKKVLLGKLRLLFTLAVLFLVAFDMFRFAHKWMPFDSQEYLYPTVPVLDFLTQESSPDRVFGFMGMEMQNYFRIQGFDGYDPVFIQRYGELVLSADDGKIRIPGTRGVGLARRGQYSLKLINLMGGKYLMHAIADNQKVWAFPYWEYPEQFEELFYEENKYRVFKNLEAFPRAFMVYDYQITDEPQEIIDQMYDADLDLRQTIILEEDPGLEKFSPSYKLSNKTEIISYSPNQVRIKVTSEAPGLLFLSDNYYPGWIARIDGQVDKIYRADYTFRAVKVPEGTHQVDFIYQPDSFKWGVKASGVSLGLIMIIAGISQQKKNKIKKKK